MFKVGKVYLGYYSKKEHTCVWTNKTQAMLTFNNGLNAYAYSCNEYSSFTEVKPKIKKQYWLVHHDDGSTGYRSDNPNRDPVRRRIAITGPHFVEFEEGEGPGD